MPKHRDEYLAGIGGGLGKFDWTEAAQQQLDSAQVAADRRAHDRGTADRRATERLAIDADAKLCISMKQAFEAKLTDISIHGCSLEIDATMFCKGDVVWMKLDQLQHWRGTVQWADGNRIGIKFEQPFYPAVVDNIVQSSRKVVCAKAA